MESEAVKELGLCWTAFRTNWFNFSYNFPGTTVYRFVMVDTEFIFLSLKYRISYIDLFNIWFLIGTEEGGKASKGLDSKEERIKTRTRRLLGYSIRWNGERWGGSGHRQSCQPDIHLFHTLPGDDSRNCSSNGEARGWQSWCHGRTKGFLWFCLWNFLCWFHVRIHVNHLIISERTRGGGSKPGW